MCNYQAISQSSFKTHKEAIHEDVKYLCDMWEYQATDKGNLNTLKKSIHEGVKV